MKRRAPGPLSKDHVHKKPGIYLSDGRLEKRRNQYEKRMLTAIGLSAMLAVSLAGCSTSVSVPDAVRVENVGDSADGKITMDSSETVKIVPDMAKIVFAVTSEAKKADECQQKNTEALNSLTEYLKGQGIDEKSITTSGYSLNPQYDWSSNTRKLIGYEMQTEVTVSDVTVEQVGTLLSGGVNAGANEIYSVSYYSSGYDDAYAEALKKAVELARTKAQASQRPADGHSEMWSASRNIRTTSTADT